MKTMRGLVAAFLLILACLCLGQVQMRYFGDGTAVRDINGTTVFHLMALRSQGYKHVRILPRPEITWPGSGAAPIVKFSDAQLRDIERFYFACRTAGIGYLNISFEATGNVYESWWDRWRRGESTDFLTPMCEQMARLVERVDGSKRIVLEPFNELKWLKGRTWSLGLNDAGQRDLATQAVNVLWEKVVPAMRAISPKVTLFLKGPDIGAVAGPGGWQAFALRWDNTYYAIHFYERLYSNALVLTAKWPDPDAEWKQLVSDVPLLNYEAPWPKTKDGLKGAFAPVVERFGGRVVVTEWGAATAEASRTAAFGPYSADVIAAAREAGVKSLCAWVP